MLTGLVILSSGVWNEKLPNRFQEADLLVLQNEYNESNLADREKLFSFISGKTNLPLFSGTFDVSDGVIQHQPTIIHARSVAEEVRVWSNSQPFTGKIEFHSGKLVSQPGITLTGNSLLHSAPLTNIAFSRSWMGSYGKYIVAIGLLLFAFSTTISWSYYGDRAIIYLFGIKGVIYFRIIYVLAFFLASFTDTTIVWTFSGIAVALMTLPNLIGILSLHKEMKNELRQFWLEWHEHFPGKNSSKI